ncbi:WD-40 repeat protein [Microscilla marina ATCC 23134]|uniref:WD-40 repeat protein n=2 Tax=Microscilla marina TaxID=1027 RepID=A1ZFD7_MICM2|nr:WD-40 repeat protein [Microscilla marina ATCC 23134]
MKKAKTLKMKRNLAINKKPKKPDPVALDKAIKEEFFDGEHLNDAGTTLYVEAMLIDRRSDLPQVMQDHVAHCAACQREVYEFYQFMQDEDVSNSSVHAFLDEHKQSLKPASMVSKGLGKRIRNIAAAVVVLGTIGWLMLQNPSKADQSMISKIETPFINQSINVQFDELDVSNEEAKTIKLEDGTIINIPAYSFVDKKGKPIKGKVKIEYRELHNTADIIASGIPLEQDSLGVTNNLETAGMFEIRGKKGKEPVYIAQGKNIDIQFASRHDGNGFNHYYLEDGTQPLTLNYLRTNQAGIIPGAFAQSSTAKVSPQWQWIGASAITSKIIVEKRIQEAKTYKKVDKQRIDSLKEVIAQMKSKHHTDSIEYIEKLLAQQKKDLAQEQKAKADYFQLDFNMEKNPHLEFFKDVVWQYIGENKEQSPTKRNSWVFNEKWDDIKLTSLKYLPVSLTGHKAAVFSVNFSPDSRYVVSASADATAKIWDNQGRLVQTLIGHSKAVTKALFSPDGQKVLTASDDFTAKLWNKQGNLLANLSGHKGKVLSIDFSANGKLILTAAADNTIKLWNNQGRLLHTMQHKYALKEARFAPNSKNVLSVSKKGPVKIWYIDGKLLHTLEGDHNSVGVSKDSKYLVTTSVISETGSGVWSSDGELLHSIKGSANQAIFSNDGTHLITIANRTAHLFSIYQKGVRTVLIKNMGGSYKGKGHLQKINNIQFSPSQHAIVTASDDYLAKIWDGSGNFRYNLRGHTNKVNHATFSPNGLHIATASADNTVKLWVETSQKDIYELELIKERRVVETNGRRVEIRGKNFVTIVRKATSDEIPEELQTKGLVHKSFTQNKDLSDMIARYEQAVKQKANKQRELKAKKPKVRAKVLRSFTVRRFGVYGAHRVFKMEENIICKAEFDFGPGVDHQDENIKVYLITGEQGTAVVPYTQRSWHRFQFDPNMANKLIAILPNDRLAVIEKREFANIDVDKVDQAGSYTFKLHPRPIQSKQDLDFVLN